MKRRKFSNRSSFRLCVPSSASTGSGVASSGVRSLGVQGRVDLLDITVVLSCKREKMPALRMFLLSDDTVMGVFVWSDGKTDQRPIWKRTIIIEPSGVGFSVCDGAAAEKPLVEPGKECTAEISFLSEEDPVDSRRTPGIRHHITEFCASSLLPSVRQLIRFRNTYSSKPVLIWHATTKSYLGISAMLQSSPRPISVSKSLNFSTSTVPTKGVVHWPSSINSKWCEISTSEDDYGAARISSVDGLAEFVLAQHAQMCRITFPVATVTTRDLHQKGIAGEMHQHAMITQLVWVHQCPESFSIPLELAQQLLSKKASSNDNATTSEGNMNSKMATLPKALLSNDSASNEYKTPNWSCAAEIDATCGSGISAESAVLCLHSGGEDLLGASPNHHIPPISKSSQLGGISRFVSVEWTPKETYWNSYDGALSGALLSHSSVNDVDALGHSKGPKHTFMTCSSAGYVRTFRNMTSSEKSGSRVVVVSLCDAHVPDPRERHAVKHMQAHLFHMKTALLSIQDRELPLTSFSAPQVDSTRDEDDGLCPGNFVREEANVAGIGQFICYRDGKIRCSYEDRTIVRLSHGEHDSTAPSGWNWSSATAEILRPDGICLTTLCKSVDENYLFYVRTAVEFGEWAMSTEEDRITKVEKEKDYYNRILNESNRIRRFLKAECLLKETEGALKGKSDSGPKRTETNESVSAECLPSRKVLSALAKQALQDTQSFMSTLTTCDEGKRKLK